MRLHAIAIFAVAALSLPTVAVAQEYNYNPDRGRVERDWRHRHEGRSAYGANCRELRRACLNKEELGEVGRGNCQRYRELCR